MSKDFDRLYDEEFEVSNQQEYLRDHRERFRELYYLLNKIKPKKILDIGESGFTNIIKRIYEVRVLNKADCNLEEDKIPYKDNTFDVVIYTEVIEHLHYNYLESLKEVYRILKPKGTMVFSTPNKKSLLQTLFPEKMKRDYHPFLFSMRSCEKILKKAGFKIIFKKFSLSNDIPKLYYYKYSHLRWDAFFIAFLCYRALYYFSKILPSFRTIIFILATKEVKKQKNE